MDKTLIIVPTYNERYSLEPLIARVRRAVPDAQILIVDDNSPDGTGAHAAELAAADPSISVLHRAAKDGLGRAYLAGFEYALASDYVYIAQIDADGSHDPAALPDMLNLAEQGADLVIGSRWVAGGAVEDWPWLRQAISRGGNVFARVLLRSHVRDITAGFRVFRASTLGSLELSSVASQGYCFQIEIAWRSERNGLDVREYPITFRERSTGRSKMHLGIVIEAFWRVTAWGLGMRLRGAWPQR
jgi:dolichol-phosphate mannosyltransferase